MKYLNLRRMRSAYLGAIAPPEGLGIVSAIMALIGSLASSRRAPLPSPTPCVTPTTSSFQENEPQPDLDDLSVETTLTHGRVSLNTFPCSLSTRRGDDG